VQIPPLMAEVLRRATKDSGCKVVGELAGLDHVLAGVRWKRADVVLVAMHGSRLATPLETVLRRCPRLRMLAVERDGAAVFAYELHPKRLALGELSLSELVDALASRTLLQRRRHLSG
jgi:hypothetical protein